MSMTLEELEVIIDARIGPYKQKMKEVEQRTRSATDSIKKQTSGLKAMFSKLGRLAAFAVVGQQLLNLGRYSTQMALEVAASMNQIKRQMGESSQAFLKWVNNNANAMNMSVGDATKYAGVYSNLFSGFIKDGQKLSAYTAKMLQTSAVVAEGTGRSITDVMERIRSGLLGNTEAIEDLGINVNVAMIESTNAFKKFANGQAWKDLDYNTQQQIRLMAILEQASAKYGNTLSNSVNGRISLFKSLLKDAALNVGNAMLPVINAMMPVLNSLAMVLKNVTAKLAEFIGLMFNKRAKVKDGAVSQANQGLQNMANNAGGAGDADDDGGSGSGSPKGGKGGGGGKGKGGGGSGSPTDILPEIALEDMDNQFKSIFDGWGDKFKGLMDYLSKLWDLFKSGFSSTFRWDSLERLKKAIEGIAKSIADIFEDGTVLDAAARFGEKLSYALGQIVGAIANILMGLAVFIAESLNKSLNETKWDIKSWLIRQFDIGGDAVASIGNIARDISHVFYDTLTSEPATDIGSHIISAFTYAYMGVTDYAMKLLRDHLSGIEQILSDNKGRLTQFFTGLLSAAEPIFASLKDLIKNTMSKWNEAYDEHFKPFIDSFYNGISQITGILLDSWNQYIQPVIDNFGTKFQEMYDSYLQPAIDSCIEAFGKFYDVLKVLWEEGFVPVFSWIAENILPILAPIIDFLGSTVLIAIETIAVTIKGIMDILQGIIDFVVGVFTGDWQRAWEGIKEMFSGFVDLLGNLINLLWELIKSIFQAGIDFIVAVVKAGWDGIVTIFKGLGQWFGDRWNDVKNLLAPVGQWIKDKFKEGWDGLTNIFQGIGNWFGQRWNDVKNALSAVNTWLGNKFQEGYNAIIQVFSGIGNFFSGVWNTVMGIFTNAGVAIGQAVGGAFRSAVNGVLGTIENVVNGFIGMINGVIGLINKIPGVHLGGIGTISLPRLAKGGIVDSATLAIVGEAGKEAVMPLENNTGWITDLASKVADRMPNTGSSDSDGRPIEIIIKLGSDSAELGRALIRNINSAQEQAGTLLLNI